MRWLARLFIVVSLCAAPAAQAEEKILLGWIEPVLLDPELGLKLYAKLDTGADTSSLDAHHIRRVRVGDRVYVRFAVRHPETHEFVELRKPFVRRVRIKRHGGLYQRRYVVRMQVCVGNRTRAIEINLIDRATFAYPMLLGRSALEGWSVVDPDNSHTTSPTCWTDPGEMPDDLAPNPVDPLIADAPAGVSVPTARTPTAIETNTALATTIPAPARAVVPGVARANGTAVVASPLAAVIPVPAGAAREAAEPVATEAGPADQPDPENEAPAASPAVPAAQGHGGGDIDDAESDAVQSPEPGGGDTDAENEAEMPAPPPEAPQVDEPEAPPAPPDS